MKVLFTHSYFLHFDPKQVIHAQPYPPLGTLIAAACAREEGHEVKLHDTFFAKDARALAPVLDGFEPDVLVIYDDGFNYLTKMCLSNMRDAAMKMQDLARQRGCKVVVSSSDAADHYTKYLKGGADYVMIGEGEQTLIGLLDLLAKGKVDCHHIRGLAYVENGEVKLTAPRPVMRELDDLPLPAWDLVDIRPYREMWVRRHGFFSINVATTRGCPYKCNWCAKPIYGNSYHMRSPASVIAELKMLRDLFQNDHVWFCDDIFGLKRSWVTEFADLVRKEDLKLRFKIQSRADLLVQERYVSDLAAAGCAEVWMGAESGSQKVLDAMDKGTTVEQIRRARALLKKHGVRACFFLQFGYSGETHDDIRRTIDLVKETMPDDIGISVSYPLPGTLFYERVKSELGIKTNWKHSDELALMFRNTYPASFYKTLHRFVHSVFRREKAAWIMRSKGPLLARARAAGSYMKHAIRGGMQNVRLKRTKAHAH